jgi:hypothetical protein
MEKKAGSKELRRFCTGMTVPEVKKEIRAMQKGKKAPKKCYLCKRSEGDKSVILTPDQKEPYFLAEIALLPIQRNITKDWAFDYLLCWECAVLLGLKTRPDGLKKGTQSKKVPTQFLPPGPATDLYS